MDRVCGKDQKATLILDNGGMEKLMAMVSILGLMVIDMKDNLSSV